MLWDSSANNTIMKKCNAVNTWNSLSRSWVSSNRRMVHLIGTLPELLLPNFIILQRKHLCTTNSILQSTNDNAPKQYRYLLIKYNKNVRATLTTMKTWNLTQVNNARFCSNSFLTFSNTIVQYYKNNIAI